MPNGKSLIAVAAVAMYMAFCGAAQAAQASKTMLWKVTSPHRTVYITGVTQMLSPKNYPLPKAIVKAFTDSSALILEGNPSKEGAKKAWELISKTGMLPPGKTLGSLLGKDDKDLVANAFSQLGFPFSHAERLRPWLASLVMMQTSLKHLGVDPEIQETLHFYDKAKARGIPVEFLENNTYQIEMFSGMPQKEAIAWLTMLARRVPKLAAIRAETLQAWQDGDTQALAGMLKKTFAGNRDLYAFLVTDRNKAWEKTLTHTLDKSGKPVFVAVGAGHLVGRGNLILGLEKAGFKVTQM